MRIPNDYIQIPAAADPSQPTSVASFIWVTVLTMAVIGSTLALSCVTPFAALAVALAGTVGLRTSLRIMAVVWFANQVIGFAFFHFPHTLNTYCWTFAIGAATLVATVVASVLVKYGSAWSAPFRLGVTLVFSFVAYEITLLPAAGLLNGLETFRPEIVAQLAFVNAISLVGMVVLNEITAALGKPWFGRMPRLARSS
jgi:hypothetical protein